MLKVKNENCNIDIVFHIEISQRHGFPRPSVVDHQEQLQFSVKRKWTNIQQGMLNRTLQYSLQVFNPLIAF